MRIRESRGHCFDSEHLQFTAVELEDLVGVVGDLHTVVPQLTEEVTRRKG